MLSSIKNIKKNNGRRICRVTKMSTIQNDI